MAWGLRKRKKTAEGAKPSEAALDAQMEKMARRSAPKAPADGLLTEIEALAGQVSRLTGTLAEDAERQGQLKGLAGTAGTAVQGLGARMETVIARDYAARRRKDRGEGRAVARILSRIEGDRSGTAALAKQVEGLSSRIKAEFRSSRARAESLAADIDASAARSEALAAGTEARLERIEAALAGTDARLARIETGLGEIADLRGGLEAVLGARLEGLGEAIAENSRGARALAEGIEAAGPDPAMPGILADLAARIDTLEAAASEGREAIKAHIDALAAPARALGRDLEETGRRIDGLKTGLDVRFDETRRRIEALVRRTARIEQGLDQADLRAALAELLARRARETAED